MHDDIEGRYGVCPRCRNKHDGYVSNRRDAWFVCDLHRLRWFAADVRDLTKASERSGAKRDVAAYDVIDPVYPATSHPGFSMAGRPGNLGKRLPMLKRAR